MLQKFIVLVIIAALILLIGILYLNNNNENTDKDSEKKINTIHELTIKQIYDIYLTTWGYLYNMDFDKITNMNTDLLLYIKHNIIVFQPIDKIIYHEISRNESNIVVKFFVRLVNGKYAESIWEFDKTKKYINNIDNLIKGTK